MAKIPWYIWLIVGGGIFFISARIGERMDAFLYVGMFLVAIGIFKAIVRAILGMPAKQALAEAKELRAKQFSCTRCKAIVASTYGYCPHCGTRLR